MPYDMYEAEDGIARRRRAASSGRTAPSATSPVRRPAAGRSRWTATGALRRSGPPGRRPTPWSPASPSRTRRAAAAPLDAEHLRQRHLPQDDRPDLEVRVAVRRRGQPGQLARRRRPAAHLRRGQRACSGRTVPAGAHDQAAEGRRPTRATYAIDFINLEQVVADRQPGPDAGTSCRPASPSRTCRTRWTRPGRTPRQARRLPARRRLPDVAASSRSTAGRSRSSAPGPGTPGSTPAGPGEHRRRLPRRGHRQRLDVHATSPSSATTPAGIDGPGKVWGDLTGRRRT